MELSLFVRLQNLETMLMYHSVLLLCGASFTAEALKRRNDNRMFCSTRAYSVNESLPGKKEKQQWQGVRFQKSTWMLVDLLPLWDRL
ncbi:uncharacterized protein P174DRAFT_445233 [Aspergillus novofumigatus IBT 16806]|uniref:Uncharacterized protein n=1 Tax=Aspergillus novofumigatus (strain IBT 16806) TaxID=1392255 RepID=A0A2I1BY60_ASPN1|nr:uncharacterized protein P174DRAFT_445233 [Aspergillus novofumigatus IBT 16806]PKX90306.1 hypothetical protein P174DRAFT_445233 [Aspergillus novofumigatus IBT 16806]